MCTRGAGKGNGSREIKDRPTTRPRRRGNEHAKTRSKESTLARTLRREPLAGIVTRAVMAAFNAQRKWPRVVRRAERAGRQLERNILARERAQQPSQTSLDGPQRRDGWRASTVDLPAAYVLLFLVSVQERELLRCCRWPRCLCTLLPVDAWRYIPRRAHSRATAGKYCCAAARDPSTKRELGLCTVAFRYRVRLVARCI